MAKTETKRGEVVKVDPNLPTRPDYIAQEIEGVDELKQLIRPPIIKIVQKQSDDETIEKFGIGNSILVPTMVVFAANDEPFHFVPLFFFRQWATWSGIKKKGIWPNVLERTLDPGSVIARKSQDKNLRFEEDYEYEGDRGQVRHVEHLTFVITPVTGPFAGELLTLSFERGEFGTGTNFASLISMRKASLYDCVFEARVCKKPRTNAQGSWYGWDVTNPGPESGVSQWVTEEQHEEFKEMHGELKEGYEQRRLVSDLGDAIVEDEETGTGDDEF